MCLHWACVPDYQLASHQLNSFFYHKPASPIVGTTSLSTGLFTTILINHLFYQTSTFLTRALIFHRWVSETKSASIHSKDSGDKRVKYFLTSSRHLVSNLLFIGNIELNPGPGSNVLLSILLHLWGLYANHVNCHRLGLFNTMQNNGLVF